MFIESYSFGCIEINGRMIKNDILIAGNEITDWWRREGHMVLPEDLDAVWKFTPDILIIGRGADSVMRVSEDVVTRCEDLGIELMSCGTDDAVHEFNRISGIKRTACGLHLTC